MTIIDLEKEIINNHSDEEIIAFLYKVMSGIAKNYNSGLSEKSSEYLWGSFADVVMVKSILGEMKHRNDEREAQRQSMIQ